MVLSVGAQDNGRLSQISLPLSIRIEPLDTIVQIAVTGSNIGRVILLPPFKQTLALVDAYIQYLDPTQHCIHCPTIKSRIRFVYDRLERGEAMEPNQCVLVLSIIAAMTCYWGVGQCPNPIFSHQQMTCKVGQLWLRTTLDILEHVRRSAVANLETLQASVISTALIFHMEG
jgi:hypothetical protein